MLVTFRSAAKAVGSMCGCGGAGGSGPDAAEEEEDEELELEARVAACLLETSLTKSGRREAFKVSPTSGVHFWRASVTSTLAR